MKVIDGYLCIGESDIEMVSVNFADELGAQELLTSVSVTEVDEDDDAVVGGDLTITGDAVNATTYEEDATGDTVAVGQAAQCIVSGQQVGQIYRLRFEVTTDASTPRTLNRIARLKCI